MANMLRLIEMGKISENPLNERSMNRDEIELIKESIMEVGLLHPLVVYEDGGDHFTLVSGHKRFKALKELGRMATATVQCTVVDKPSDVTQERELLARGNIGRTNPEQIANEIKLVSNIWNTMDPERRRKLTEGYRAAFESAHALDPLYLADPEQFMSNRFRPRMEYINALTGLNMSNKTITRHLKSTLKAEDEALVEEERPKKERTVSLRQIIHSMENMQRLIDGYVATHEEVPGGIILLQSELKGAMENPDGTS